MINSWSRGALIGEGGFGKVYLCINNTTGGLFVSKEVVGSPGTHFAELENEIHVLSALSHPHIVSYLGARQDGSTLSIFMEYIAGGSVADILNNFIKLEEPVVQLYTRQLLKGLHYLHQNHYVHRDVKTSNVLVGIDGTVKIADFGTALKLHDALKLQTEDNCVGTLRYIPPERVRHRLVGAPTDIWATGCVVIEMLTGNRPYAKFSNPYAAIYRCPFPEIPEGVSLNARDFLQSCFADHQIRPNASMLLDHQFMVHSNDTMNFNTTVHNSNLYKIPPPLTQRSISQMPRKYEQTITEELTEDEPQFQKATYIPTMEAVIMPSDLEKQMLQSKQELQRKELMNSIVLMFGLLVLGCIALASVVWMTKSYFLESTKAGSYPSMSLYDTETIMPSPIGRRLLSITVDSEPKTEGMLGEYWWLWMGLIFGCLLSLAQYVNERRKSRTTDDQPKCLIFPSTSSCEQYHNIMDFLRQRQQGICGHPSAV